MSTIYSNSNLTNKDKKKKSYSPIITCCRCLWVTAASRAMPMLLPPTTISPCKSRTA